MLKLDGGKPPCEDSKRNVLAGTGTVLASPMENSSHLLTSGINGLPDFEALRARLQRDGYLFLKGAILP